MPLLLLSSSLHPLSLKGLSLSLPLCYYYYKFQLNWLFICLCRSRVLPPLSFSILSKIGLLGLIGYSLFNSCSSDGIQNRPMIFVGSVRLYFRYFTLKAQEFSHFCFLSDFYFQSEFLLGWEQEFVSDHGVYRHQFQLSNTCFSHQQPGASFHLHPCHPFQVLFPTLSISYQKYPHQRIKISRLPLIKLKGVTFCILTETQRASVALTLFCLASCLFWAA